MLPAEKGLSALVIHKEINDAEVPQMCGAKRIKNDTSLENKPRLGIHSVVEGDTLLEVFKQ